LLALLGWFAGRSAAGFLRRQRPRAVDGNLIEVAVDGMTCSACVARLERTLNRDEEVETVRIELEPGRAVVSGRVSKERVRELVEQAGFTPVHR